MCFYVCIYIYCYGAGYRPRARPTARWSSRVDSTEHPESRSYLSENSEGTGPFPVSESSIIPPRGTGFLPIFKIPRDPRGKLRVFTPSTALVRVEPLACPTCAQPERMVAEVPSVQMYIYSDNSLCNSPTRTMLSQWKEHRNKPIHLTNGEFIHSNRGNEGST